MPNLKVMAILDTYRVSGPCRGLYQLVEELEKLGIETVVSLFLLSRWKDCPAIEEAKKRGLTIEILRQYRRFDPGLVIQLYKIAKKHHVHLIQSHNYKPAFLAWCLKPMIRVPWVAFAHGYTHEDSRIACTNSRIRGKRNQRYRV